MCAPLEKPGNKDLVHVQTHIRIHPLQDLGSKLNVVRGGSFARFGSCLHSILDSSRDLCSGSFPLRSDTHPPTHKIRTTSKGKRKRVTLHDKEACGMNASHAIVADFLVTGINVVHLVVGGIDVQQRLTFTFVGRGSTAVPRNDKGTRLSTVASKESGVFKKKTSLFAAERHTDVVLSGG
jgi:hypothetical protein